MRPIILGNNFIAYLRARWHFLSLANGRLSPADLHPLKRYAASSFALKRFCRSHAGHRCGRPRRRNLVAGNMLIGLTRISGVALLAGTLARRGHRIGLLIGRVSLSPPFLSRNDYAFNRSKCGSLSDSLGVRVYART